MAFKRKPAGFLVLLRWCSRLLALFGPRSSGLVQGQGIEELHYINDTVNNFVKLDLCCKANKNSFFKDQNELKDQNKQMIRKIG